MPVIHQPLNVGQTYPLSGTTAAQHPQLNGTVVHDELIDLPISKTNDDPNPLTVRLQVRIVRSTQTGTLDFCYRLMNELSTPAILARAYVIHFAAVHNVQIGFADFRPDGLGTVAPTTFSAALPPGGQTDPADRIYAFQFKQSIPGNGGTRFFFVSTNATNFSLASARFVYDTGLAKDPGIEQLVPGPSPR